MNPTQRILIFTCCAMGGAAPTQANWAALNAINLDVQHQSTMAQLHAQSAEQALRGSRASTFAADPSSSATMATANNLRFNASRSRRLANYARFVEQSRRVDPAGAEGLQETLRSDPIKMMGPELAKVGLRTDNLADAYTVYWVEAWQAAHGVAGASSRETAEAVKRQAVNAILATPEFAQATDAQKQEFADALLVQALLIGAAREQANGDQAKLRQIAAAVRQGAKASGLDLDAMTLTEQGFVPAQETGAAEGGPAAPGEEPRALAATKGPSDGPSYALLAAVGGAGLGAAFLLGKVVGRSRG